MTIDLVNNSMREAVTSVIIQKLVIPFNFELINNAGKLMGRYDVCCPMMSAWDLHKAWPEADLKVVPDAGHSANEPGIAAELVAANEKLKNIIKNGSIGVDLLEACSTTLRKTTCCRNDKRWNAELLRMRFEGASSFTLGFRLLCSSGGRKKIKTSRKILTMKAIKSYGSGVCSRSDKILLEVLM
ncbi:PROLINE IMINOPEPTIDASE [Salix koriyanagi]|uniref:PROLINE IMINOPEPTIDASE n=1 Tax=Salix koriyanagi TaxID=2511006 RepID=A0A9Q0X3H5_9ROSI|nr:PROLINE IMINOPEPTIDASE [Salix koriyanagi]